MRTTSAPTAQGRRFFPLNHQLRLRADHWSEGAARVATRQGLREASFAEAADAYTEAVGGAISPASLRRVTEGFGHRLAAVHEATVQQAVAVGPLDESPRARRVALQDPIDGLGNLSSDGTMVLVREEGWKEAKMATCSQVDALPPDSPRRRAGQRQGKRSREDVVRLSRHSYCAGLWDADTFGTYQYAEGLRRGLDQVAQLSSVNDGAVWIERITATNFPQAHQIVDWSHSTQRLWAVAHAVYGEGHPAAAAWVALREDELWVGQVEDVIAALEKLNLDQAPYPDLVRQAPGYFRNNRDRMRYDEFRAAGYPIGSGTVESGARNVVQPRLRRPGRGWTRENAQAMLAGVCELHSGRFDWAWRQVYHAAA